MVDVVCFAISIVRLYMNVLGRIVARGDVVGLFMPMGDKSLDDIYQIEENMGELTIRRIGDPDMHRNRYTGLGLDKLYARPQSCMTHEELVETGEYDGR